MSSQLFYRRKLATFNLTVYDLGINEGHCYVWHEGVAKRDANNIATCVFDFIKTKSELGVKDFSFFSDNCSGQNKNKAMHIMYLHCLRKFDPEQITHYY
jgi:hypothetical protein